MSEVIKVLPDDEYNGQLVSNVHPPDWVNPVPAECYNLVVIGAGTAGLVTAAGAAGLGAKVALIEKHLLGGDCLNVGCVPSKAIIRSSRVVADIREAQKYGVTAPCDIEVDFTAVMERMRCLRAGISRHDSLQRFQDELGVDVYLGKGCFIEPNKIEVAGKILCFHKVVLATGARAVRPRIEGLEEAGYLTNETVFSLTERPKRLAVMGGGPIGCELSQAFCRLGCEVILFHKYSHLLNREDEDAAEILQNKMVDEGIRLVLNCVPEKVSKKGAEKVVHFEAEGRKKTVTVDEILVGTGRAPNVEGLNLELAGVKYDNRSGVTVNDFLQTTSPDVYAAGDICLKHKFTHTADAAARIVIQNALFKGHKRVSTLTVPWCTYTDPEIAHVGMYEREALDRGIPVETFKKLLNEVDRAVLDGEDEGFVKVHVRKGGDEILGATIVARHAGEMINEITLAMVSGLGLGTISGVIHPYPTQAEAIKQVADAYNRTRLIPFVKKLFAKAFSLTR